jgi:phage anti-repressor protein
VIVKQAETNVAQEAAATAIGRLRTAEGDLCLIDAAKALGRKGCPHPAQGKVRATGLPIAAPSGHGQLDADPVAIRPNGRVPARGAHLIAGLVVPAQAERAVARLLPVQPHRIGEGRVETIAATKLHTYLEVGTEAAKWMERRIGTYGFVEGVDYVLETRSSELTGKWGGQNAKEWHLTLDMAKELAMVERNEKGREARRYFINCERRLKAAAEGDTKTLFDVAEEAASAVALNPRPVEGELRILDVELGKRLGFTKPTKIRDAIKRHAFSLGQLGPLPTVGRVINGGEATEYYLNRKQAVFITAKSDTPDATAITESHRVGKRMAYSYYSRRTRCQRHR